METMLSGGRAHLYLEQATLPQAEAFPDLLPLEVLFLY